MTCSDNAKADNATREAASFFMELQTNPIGTNLSLISTLTITRS